MNNFFITGTLKSVEKNYLLLEFNHTIFYIIISNGLKNNLLEFVSLNTLISVKGVLSQNCQRKLELKATKIFLLKT